MSKNIHHRSVWEEKHHQNDTFDCHIETNADIYGRESIGQARKKRKDEYNYRIDLFRPHTQQYEGDKNVTER
jgi:hypothetical protein